MWLPHYISVFLWISHINLYESAAVLGGPSFWFPYDFEDGFLHDAEHYQPDHGVNIPAEPEAKPRGCWSCHSSSSTRVSEPSETLGVFLNSCNGIPLTLGRG
jgi:hypothetical protein